MKIKKVDDKPMVIHTKQKAEIHTHEPKQASIKGDNIYTVCRADVTLTYELNGGTENDTTKPVTKTVYCNAATPQEVKGFKLQLGESVKESVDLDGYTHSYAFAIWAQNSPESETRFPCNAGTAARNVPERMEVQYGEEVVLPEQKPERTGFIFTG